MKMKYLFNPLWVKHLQKPQPLMLLQDRNLTFKLYGFNRRGGFYKCLGTN